MTKPLTVLLRLECRGIRRTEQEYFSLACEAPEDSTLESLSHYVLEKTSESPFGITVKRTQLRVEQYDPQERQLLVSHSLVASKADDFISELLYGHGFKRQEPLPHLLH